MGYLSAYSYWVLKHTEHRKNHADDQVTEDWVKITVSILSTLTLFHANSSILRKTARGGYTFTLKAIKWKITDLQTKLLVPLGISYSYMILTLYFLSRRSWAQEWL